MMLSRRIIRASSVFSSVTCSIPHVRHVMINSPYGCVRRFMKYSQCNSGICMLLTQQSRAFTVQSVEATTSEKDEETHENRKDDNKKRVWFFLKWKWIKRLIKWFHARPYRVHVLANIGYSVSLVGYLITDMLWFRSVLMIGQAIVFVFQMVTPQGPLMLNMRWTLVFISINLVQIGVLLLKARPITLSGSEISVYENGLRQHGVSKFDLQALMKFGEWKTFECGDVVDDHECVMLVTDGQVDVSQNDHHVGNCRGGDFIGEMQFLNPETTAHDAKLTAIVPTTAFVWPTKALKEFLTKSTTLENQVIRTMTDNLLSKLVDHQDASKLEGYVVAMCAALSGDTISSQTRVTLEDYREMYFICPLLKQRLLLHCGWTSDEWEEGKRGNIDSVVEIPRIVDIAAFANCSEHHHEDEDTVTHRITFGALDFDDDGFITVNDLRRLGFSQVTITQCIAECDMDGDGKISFNEFRHRLPNIRKRMNDHLASKRIRPNRNLINLK